MILVTGSILAREDTAGELLELSLEHVRRSREEPGWSQSGEIGGSPSVEIDARSNTSAKGT